MSTEKTDGEQGEQVSGAEPPLLSILIGQLDPRYQGMPKDTLNASHYVKLMTYATDVAFFSLISLSPQFGLKDGKRKVEKWAAGFATNISKDDLERHKQMFLLHQQQLALLNRRVRNQPKIILPGQPGFVTPADRGHRPNGPNH